ncbi:hypothetical protein [Granulosicoccus antarcticus]|nr:hypothetical protein [Granulosicoccus antarcticus]
MNSLAPRAPEYKQLVGLALVSIGLASSLAYADPSVNGAEISWPDDGWYQVQTADGETTLCNGGSSCSVEPGSYLVINHTTGIRYADVQVGNAQSNEAQSGDGDSNDGQSSDSIQVSGNTISWPDDGWYQVQTANGGESVCSGGNSCEVGPGSYLVINHTTGARFPGIEVSSSEQPVIEPSEGLINRDNHVELLSQAFSVYTGKVYGDTLPGIPQAFMESHPSTEIEVPPATLNEGESAVLFQYACDNGGVLQNLDTVYDFGDTTRTFTWNDCLDDTVVRSGTLSSRENNVGGYYRDLMFSSYNGDFVSGDTIVASGKFGSISDSNIDPSTIRIDRWTNQGVNYSFKNESTFLEVGNASTDTFYRWLDRTDDVFIAELDGSFQLSSSLTEQHTVEVLTREKLFVNITLDGSFDFIEVRPSVPYPDVPAWSFTSGEIQITADDGSSLRLNAESGDTQTAQITLLQGGIELESFQQPWSLWRDVLTSVQKDTRDSL